MRVDPELKQLAAEFRAWRKKKQHVREPIPGELIAKARRAIPTHGASVVARAIKVEHARLTKGPRQRADRRAKRLESGAGAAAKLKIVAAKATHRPSKPAKPPHLRCRPIRGSSFPAIGIGAAGGRGRDACGPEAQGLRGHAGDGGAAVGSDGRENAMIQFPANANVSVNARADQLQERL